MDISAAVAMSSGLVRHNRCHTGTLLGLNVTIVNISLEQSVDDVNIAGIRSVRMGGSPRRRPRKKRVGQYHHGDLRRALIDQALRTIDKLGVEGLTLRGVGEALGVSRTALYRHFSSKEALVAAVAREGFRTLRLRLVDAWERNGRGQGGFEAMGEAYLQFAVAHPSHYRVMFGRVGELRARDPELIEEGQAAFQALVDALVDQQREGFVRRDDPLMLARFVWSVTHGIAMLVINGQLRDGDASGIALNRYAAERIRTAIAAPLSS
jgi:AcrR family transcriptional regulator